MSGSRNPKKHMSVHRTDGGFPSVRGFNERYQKHVVFVVRGPLASDHNDRTHKDPRKDRECTTITLMIGYYDVTADNGQLT